MPNTYLQISNGSLFAGERHSIGSNVLRLMEREDWNKCYASRNCAGANSASRFLVGEVDTEVPGRALDLASGEGRNAVWLAQHGWHVTAVDFASVAIAKGVRLAARLGVAAQIKFMNADLRDYRPMGRQFDLVTVFYLQLPIVLLRPIIRRAANALAPGGVFLMVGHDCENLQRGYGGPQHPELLYTAADVVDALAGELKVEKAVRVERAVVTTEGVKRALDCMVRAIQRYP